MWERKAQISGIRDVSVVVHDDYIESDSGSDKITGWRAVIVDGSYGLKASEGDQLNLRYDERVESRKASRRAGEKGIDRHTFILLMLEMLESGAYDGREIYNFLDDDPVESTFGVPMATFRGGIDHKAYIGSDEADRVNESARFRSSVGGDELLT